MPNPHNVIVPKGEKRKLGRGRQFGVPNKVTHDLRVSILTALQEADPDGAIGYLKKMSQQEPVAFMGLVGKCLPKEVKVQSNNSITMQKMEVHRLDISGVPEDQLDTLELALRNTYLIHNQKLIDARAKEIEYEEEPVE